MFSNEDTKNIKNLIVDMTMDSKTYNLTGNQACVEAALAAGCKFFGYYPIVPCLNFIEYFIRKSKNFDATVVQMEDEISALAAVLGASWTGKKSMTVSSGPGFSNMMEHVGLGVMLETPCVIVNFQRLGPGEGIPNVPAQGDIMQARWGSHGDYEIIALAPSSPQEMFDFTIQAFNLSEKYRTPVVILTDESIAHQKEIVTIPDKIKLIQRPQYKGPKDEYQPFKLEEGIVPPMVNIGEGYKFHVTGLTHDEKGYPVMNEKCQELNVHRLVNKIRLNAEKIIQFESTKEKESDLAVLFYGSTSKSAKKAIEEAKKSGLKVESFRLMTVWPFPEKKIFELAQRVKAILVAESNYGQIVLEVERCTHGKANVGFVHCDGKDDAEAILRAIKDMIQKERKEGIIEYEHSEYSEY